MASRVSFSYFSGSCLMLVMPWWQLAHPGTPVPVIGGLLQTLFGESAFTTDPVSGVKGVLTSAGYNSFGAMHGTIMVFFGIVPIAFAAFGNFVVPLQIGAPDMTFPRINMASYWCFFISCVIMMGSFLVPGGAAKSGWTFLHPPLCRRVRYDARISVFERADALARRHDLQHHRFTPRFGEFHRYHHPVARSGNDVDAAPIFRLGAICHRLPAPPRASRRPLEAACGVMQTMDRAFGTSFFMPTGLIVNGQIADWSGGGSPILWQHLFWFLAHPEVYVLILPGIGMVAEVIACNTRKPLYGYKAMVGAIFVLGFLSFIVWAHH